MLLGLLGLAACSDDDQESQPLPDDNEGMTRVHLRISPYGSSPTTRTDWQDSENANDNEMMNIWTVVVVDADGKVKSVRVANPTTGPKQEVDNLETTVNLESNKTYYFYSFANIHPKLVMALMNGSQVSPVRTRADGDIPVNFPTNNPVERTTFDGNAADLQWISDNTPPYSSVLDGVNGYTFSPAGTTGDNHVVELIDNTDYAAFKSMTITPSNMNNVLLSVNGNGFNPDADNIYGAKGIPMSNVQECHITGTDTDIDLIVVRALAKIELRLYNETGHDLYVRSVSLTNLTANTVDNLKLLPMVGHPDDMDATHNDIEPNLGSSYRRHFTYALPTALKVDAVMGADPNIVMFYVNESQLASTTDRYYLTLGVSKTATGVISEYRYAVITGKNSQGDAVTEWCRISRNDYRIIPLVLDDYKLDLIPYDFPAIGVYPASVIEGDVYNTLTFHDYGHFHLLPLVTRFSASEEIPYNDPSADVYWTLGTVSPETIANYANSTLADNLNWFTDASFSTKQTTANADGFYRTDANGGNSTADADEAGGVPRWDNNLRWKPTDATIYRPFIYGYIADLPSGTEKAMEYHSFMVQLWKKGASEPFRSLTCNFRMVIDIPAPIIIIGGARRRCPHNGCWHSDSI